MKEKSSVFKAEGKPGEVIESFTIILDKDWMNSPDIIPSPRVIPTSSGFRLLNPLSDEEKIELICSKEEYPSIEQKYLTLEECQNQYKDLEQELIAAYKSTQLQFPDMKDLYSHEDRFKTDGNTISRFNRTSKPEDRTFRGVSKALYKTQVFLAKRKNDLRRGYSNLRSVLGNILHTRKKNI